MNDRVREVGFLQVPKDKNIAPGWSPELRLLRGHLHICQLVIKQSWQGRVDGMRRGEVEGCLHQRL